MNSLLPNPTSHNIHSQGTVTRVENYITRITYTLGSKKTYYKRTSGKHVKAEPKKEEWESLNRNGALEFYI
jgi:hypothetical protein